MSSAQTTQQPETNMDWKHYWKRCAIALLFTCGCAQASAGGIAVTLTPERQALGKDDDVRVKVTITNTSATPARLLKWALPFGDIEAPLFDVTRDGLTARYLGVRVKRAPPGDDDYLVLAPGASRSETIELSALYQMNVTGAYTVRYHSHTLQPDGAQGAQAGATELQSEPVSIWIDGRLPRGTVTPEPLPLRAMQAAAGLAFSRCSNAQQGEITGDGDRWRGIHAQGGAGRALRTVVRRHGPGTRAAGEGALHVDQGRLRDQAGDGGLWLQQVVLRVRVPVAAVHDLRLQGLLERADDRDRFEGRDAGARDEPLHRGGGDG
jgi:hypothetical protein